MATAWPSTVRADWNADKGVRTGRVAQLTTRDLVLAQQPFMFYMSELTTTNAAFTSLRSINLYVPTWAELLALTLRADWFVKTTAGTATYRIQDNASGNNSSEDTTTNAAYERLGVVSLAIAAGWGGTYRTINIQAKTSAGTCYAKSDTLTIWRYTD